MGVWGRGPGAGGRIPRRPRMDALFRVGDVTVAPVMLPPKVYGGSSRQACLRRAKEVYGRRSTVTGALKPHANPVRLHLRRLGFADDGRSRSGLGHAHPPDPDGPPDGGLDSRSDCHGDPPSGRNHRVDHEPDRHQLHRLRHRLRCGERVARVQPGHHRRALGGELPAVDGRSDLHLRLHVPVPVAGRRRRGASAVGRRGHEHGGERDHRSGSDGADHHPAERDPDDEADAGGAAQSVHRVPRGTEAVATRHRDPGTTDLHW